MRKRDAVIIGFGKGGKTLAEALAREGKQVVLIEQSEKMYGGTCINAGCIPSKSLIISAKHSREMGGSFEEMAARYYKAVEEKERVTSILRKKNYEKLSRNPNIEVLTGTAEFSGEKLVLLTYPNGITEQISASQIFINTGAKPFIPPISGADKSRFTYTSETLMSLKKLPKHLVIIGGGYIGMEFASMYTNFGSKVTVVQDGSEFLPREDEEIAAEVLSHLNAQGIEVLLGKQVVSIEDLDDSVKVTVKGLEDTMTIHAQAVLLAAGRRPEPAQLKPALAGVELNERGAVKVDEHLRTTAPGIWAMGDVTGGLQFTYISLDDYRIIKSDISGEGDRTTKNRGAVPYSVFIDPPFSRVGLSEKEAKQQGYEFRVLKLPVAAIPKSLVMKETNGLLKAIVETKTGKILGAHLFAPESHEIINIIKLAMDTGIPYTVLGSQIYTHPTMAEAFNMLFSN